MARVQKRGPNHRRRARNVGAESKAAALFVRVERPSDQVVARKRTSSHGEVFVVVSGGNVRVESANHSLPMANVDSAMDWLDHL